MIVIGFCILIMLVQGSVHCRLVLLACRTRTV